MRRATFDKLKPETFIEIPSRKLSAAGETGGGAANPAYPGKIALALLATIDEATPQLAPDQW
jgi:hypothetical protein